MDYEAKDWELNPHLYLQDSEGNFVRTKMVRLVKKVVDQKRYAEAIAARRTITRKQKNIQKLEQKLKQR